MREDYRPVRDFPPEAVAAALGVTRLARLTGLDRTGVEVYGAVRPAGHVLQVTNGKGESPAEAARGALMEAAELWAAERPDPAAHGPEAAARLRARLPRDVEVIGPGALAPDAEEGWDEVPVRWCAGATLDGRRAAVPAPAVFCPPPGTPSLGLGAAPWSSNGMGARPGGARDAAVLHALLETIERDQLARALPDAFTAEAIAPRLLDPKSLARAAPRTDALAARLRERGFEVHLLDLAPGLRDRAGGPAPRARGGRGDGPAPLDLGLPVAGALLVEEGSAAVPVAAGYACRLDPDAALHAALLEACQSRATEIHGAREDVLHSDRDAAAPLAALCRALRPERPASALPRGIPGAPAAALRALARRLARAGLATSAVIDLAAPEGLAVVKVLVPGLLVSELL